MNPSRSRSWYYEMPLFYLALMALQRGAFPADPAFRSVNPSPLWLGLLLFGLRYGIGAGMASGAVSAALLALGARQAGEAFRLGDADFWILPGLFVVAGAALGGVAERFHHRLDGLSLRLEDLVGRNNGLLAQLQSQQKAMRAVEQQVVSQMSSVVTLYHGSRELGTLDRHTLMPAMLEFFTRALDAEKAALYVPDEGGWKVLDARGWSAPDEYPRRVESGRGVIGRAAAEARPVTVKDALASLEESGAAQSGADAVMAAPILDPAGKPAAVFAVHAMPFLRFNTAAVNLLALLVEWGSESLAKCAEVESLKARSLLDEDLGVHSAGYLETRLAQEFARSKRFALPLTLVLLRVEPSPKVAAERVPALMSAVARVVRETMREVDVVCRSPYEEAQLALLLPTTTSERAVEARARAAAALAALDLPASFLFGAASYAARMARVEDLIVEARKAIR